MWLPEADRTHLPCLSAHIDGHYANGLSIQMLARIACMGAAKLKRCFKAHFGCTVASYIQEVRIERAEHLLAYTDLPAGKITKAVGYTAAGHCAKLFRKAKGVLPLE